MRVARSIRSARLVAGTALTLATSVNALLSAYLGLITVAGLRRAHGVLTGAVPTTRFVILVPAHNEQAIITDTLRSNNRYRRLPTPS